MYAKIEKGFGLFFVYVFGLSQLFIIFALFLTISQAVGSSGRGLERIIESFSMLLVTAGLSLNIAEFACTKRKMSLSKGLSAVIFY